MSEIIGTNKKPTYEELETKLKTAEVIQTELNQTIDCLEEEKSCGDWIGQEQVEDWIRGTDAASRLELIQQIRTFVCFGCGGITNTGRCAQCARL